MGVLRHRRRRHTLIQTLTALTIFLLFATATAISLSHLGSTSSQQQRELREKSEEAESRAIFGLTRRTPLGLGSSPPSCRSKCGRCSPCNPVHVPIHPGLTTPLEYYPEAWRCQCGKKLFMP
ncbi:EPIDERMAL PATTERNING FACTOR-like protein 4 [Corylus avellana]|uniref:EPIDERMAL PATTERNING FACTOR-like protein 4 n=1 Tax=Corylus avellana TaxID=13451 RepID=UPI00286CCE88|nr:EPIDERMAL PATTERNING FACTOR-like protein 4 [Corylus avellana]